MNATLSIRRKYLALMVCKVPRCCGEAGAARAASQAAGSTVADLKADLTADHHIDHHPHLSKCKPDQRITQHECTMPMARLPGCVSSGVGLEGFQGIFP